jgi:alkanesulfonate monooxygenase SsuD/methylene tetrahydromethanopterin reductase-like flavin-dependent oxidoreductase (luciferase family)
MPADFESAAGWLQPDQMRGPVLVSADVDQHIAWLQEFAALGFDELYLHHVGKDQQEFLDVFASHVLPALREADRPA